MCSTRDHSGVEGLKATIFCRNGALYPAIYVTTAFTLGCELLKPAALHPGITLFECHLRQVKQESSPLEFVNKHRNLASGSASDKEEKHFDQISTKWSHRWCLASSSATSKIRSSQLIWRSEETAAVHRKRIRKEWQQGPNCLDLRHSYTQNLVTLVIEENCTKLISPAPT